MAKVSRRYTEKERARVLTAAVREGLSGPKAAEKFGISTLTFYKWRKRAGLSGRSAAPRQVDGALASVVRSGVRAKVAAIVPSIVMEEVGAYLNQAFGTKRRT